MAKLFKMVRETPECVGGAVKANVCKASLQHFLDVGWTFASEKDRKIALSSDNTGDETLEPEASENTEEKPAEVEVTKTEPTEEEKPAEVKLTTDGKSTRSPRGRR